MPYTIYLLKPKKKKHHLDPLEISFIFTVSIVLIVILRLENVKNTIYLDKSYIKTRTVKVVKKNLLLINGIFMLLKSVNPHSFVNGSFTFAHVD